jgi:cytochrome c-type biogenesis protein
VSLTIASGALPLALLVAALAGFVSFASPCVLPLVPGFVGYVTGLGASALEQRRRPRVLLGTLLFVLGFSTVYVLGVTAASAAGAALRTHQRGVQRFGGGLLMVVGVLMVTGLWEGIMSWVQAHLVTGFQTPL